MNIKEHGNIIHIIRMNQTMKKILKIFIVKILPKQIDFFILIQVKKNLK